MNMFKNLLIIRGQSKYNFKCDNGDVYDSSSRLYDINGIILHESEFVNTDSTNGYKGGKLAPIQCYAISGWRNVSYQKEPIRVLKFFKLLDGQKIEDITNENVLTEKNFTLESSIPNSNHNNEMIVTFVQGHPGGQQWDWSHSCQTWLNFGNYNGKPIREFDELMKNIKDGEIITVQLIENV
jgi:hypothetical protein